MANEDNGHGNGPKYFLNIEGVEHPWDQDTVTTEQILQLAGWPAGTVVVEVDADQNELTLTPNGVIDVKPGHGFGKKIKFKRG